MTSKLVIEPSVENSRLRTSPSPLPRWLGGVYLRFTSLGAQSREICEIHDMGFSWNDEDSSWP